MENSQRYKAMREITDQTNVKYGSHHLKWAPNNNVHVILKCHSENYWIKRTIPTKIKVHNSFGPAHTSQDTVTINSI
jgi:hypothetical protein